MAFAFGEESRWYDQYFMKGLALPSSSSKTSETALGVGKTQGALKLVIAAADDVSIPSGATLKLTMLESDNEDGPFTVKCDAPELMFSGGDTEATTFMSKDTLGQVVLPNSKLYMKVKLTTEGAPTGSVDVFLGYLAR